MRRHFSVFLFALLSLNLLSRSVAGQIRSSPPDMAAVDRRAESILSKMTLEEKIDLLGGVDGFFIRGIPRVGWPRLKMADGPMGVRNFGPATVMAAGIGLAATWNLELAERVRVGIGRDGR